MPHFEIVGLKPKPLVKVLREHQEEGVNATLEAGRGQIIFPTGTGKTVVQSRSIVEHIRRYGIGVYIVLSHRIMLSNQLFGELREDLDAHDIDAQYLVVHSNRVEDRRDYEVDVKYRQVSATVSPRVIEVCYEKAMREGVSLVISGTYHSMSRIIDSGIPVKVAYCDEAHKTVDNNFSWIIRNFPAEKMFFFTATRRVSAAFGMNNEDIYGPIIAERAWAETVIAGESLPGRIHEVNVDSVVGDGEIGTVTTDVRVLIASFEEHQEQVGDVIGAKLLVVSKGSEHLDEIVSHPEMIEYCAKNGIHIYDKSSEHGDRINGERVSTTEFLRSLKERGEKDDERMIIVHIQTLTEGIDVPGITGILPFNSLGDDVFIQTLGRATRLYRDDRIKLYSGEITPDDTEEFVKRFAWIVVPNYGDLGAEILASIESVMNRLRSGAVIVKEVTVSTSRGVVEREGLDDQNELDERRRTLQIELDAINHRFEDAEAARVLKDYKKNMDIQDLDELLEFELPLEEVNVA